MLSSPLSSLVLHNAQVDQTANPSTSVLKKGNLLFVSSTQEPRDKLASCQKMIQRTRRAATRDSIFRASLASILIRLRELKVHPATRVLAL